MTGHAIALNAHVLQMDAEILEVAELKPADVEFVARPGTDHGGTWQEVSPTRRSLHHDLAVFEPACTSVATLTAAVVQPVQGDEVLLAGFPNWQSGDPVRFETASVTHRRTKSMVRWIQVSATIEKGNSGGPVLDATGKVIGIATKGEGGVPLAHAAVSIDHISDLSDTL